MIQEYLYLTPIQQQHSPSLDVHHNITYGIDIGEFVTGTFSAKIARPISLRCVRGVLSFFPGTGSQTTTHRQGLSFSLNSSKTATATLNRQTLVSLPSNYLPLLIFGGLQGCGVHFLVLRDIREG